MTPIEILAAGRPILAGVLEPHGFAWLDRGSGTGSGGDYAAGEFSAFPRRISFSVRFGLGLVEYSWGFTTIAHDDLVRVIGFRAAYPGFSADPLAAFRDLARDLSSDEMAFFVRDPDEARFRELVELAASPRSRLP